MMSSASSPGTYRTHVKRMKDRVPTSTLHVCGSPKQSKDDCESERPSKTGDKQRTHASKFLTGVGLTSQFRCKVLESGRVITEQEKTN